MIPQLRTRTEFSFRAAYGQIDKVVARLLEIGCPAAGIVDAHCDTFRQNVLGPSTWGHVKWEKALTKAGIVPMFGAELPVEQVDGRKPTAWLLAEDTRAFYQFVTSNPKTQDDYAGARGVIRFAGAALTDPATFDYIDINPSSLTRTRDALALAKTTHKPVVVTSANAFPRPDDLNRLLAISDSRKMTPQWICSLDELKKSMRGVPDDLWLAIIANTHEVAERLAGVKLQKAPLIKVDGDLRALADAGKGRRLAAGHIVEWTPEYEARLQRELDMIAQKAFESYFLVVSDLVRWAKARMLVGPARGSSAGSLVCYLIEITEVDPLVHNLLFERFIDVTRNDLPDIDIDFNDNKRELVFEYIADRYGKETVARIGSINNLKPKSVIAEVGKRLGVPMADTYALKNVIIEYTSGDSRYGKGLEDTMNGTNPGREFTAKYPAARLMADVENHAWHTGVHAAGIIVCNDPVADYCVVKDGVAQIDKPDAEHLNLLKIDVLGLRTLGVIEDAGVITPKQLYSLPLNDPAVLGIFNQHKYSGIFQFEGATQRQVAAQVDFRDFTIIDHVTALARPGPLGGGASSHYIARHHGREEMSFTHPSMQRYLGDTNGVVLYQEQVMRIVRELGDFSWEQTTVIRKAMSGRKGKEFFDQQGAAFVVGAAKNDIAPDIAADLWNQLCNFGAWGMNRSHTVSYAVISYWCAYMKHYHPLEYAASCLRNAKDEEQTIEILREMESEGIAYIPFDADLSEINWAVKDGKLVGGFMNLDGVGPAKAVTLTEQRRLGTLNRDKLAAMTCKYNDLRPAHTLYGHLYRSPEIENIAGRIKEIAELKDQENAVIICKMLSRTRRDENEAVLIKRRNGETKTGQTQFLDIYVVDDSVSKPSLLRVRPKNWNRLGVPVADHARDNIEWFLVRGRWLGQFNMMIVEKMRCLTNEKLFDA